jgi:predicted SAM-dependent methyltransferase
MSSALKKIYNNARKNSLYRLVVRVYRTLEKKHHLANEGTGFYCPGCKRYWKSFRPFPQQWLKGLRDSGWPYEPEDVETLNYKNYSCYGCGITDRDRLYILFFEKILSKNKSYKILEFAPRLSLSNFLKGIPNVTHRTVDLLMSNVDDKLDIQDLYLYKDNTFNIFICSHVLEHVTDDIKAMKELYRILSPAGFGITMVPILQPVTVTREDPAVIDSKLKLQYFGQADHVRLYAKQQFIKRLESVGFKVKLYRANDFGKELFQKSGITQKSVLYVVEK